MLFETEVDECCDIYYETRYGSLYNEIENGVCCSVKHISEYGTVMTTFIRRKVPWLIDGKQYYDIMTPYGYGGPVVLNTSDKGKLIDRFRTDFSEYCLHNDIICEFVRFHPLLNNAVDWMDIYDVQIDRKTIAIDLRDPDITGSQFGQKCRNNIRKSIKNGVMVAVDQCCHSVDSFADIYYETMKKNNADSFYFFPMEYFERIIENFGSRVCIINAFYCGRIISASLFIRSEKYAHCHLSATIPSYYNCASNNLIWYKACEYFGGLNCEWLHLGGGLTPDDEDSLFRFKRTFGKNDANIKEFYIGKKVWNQRIFDQVMELYLASGNKRTSFFPEYRQSRGGPAVPSQLQAHYIETA